MPLYRKKAVLDDAEQFTDLANPPRGVRWEPTGSTEPRSCYVETIQGQRVSVGLGEWIIAEADGVHFYPCSDEAFRRTHEMDPVKE